MPSHEPAVVTEAEAKVARSAAAALSGVLRSLRQSPRVQVRPEGGPGEVDVAVPAAAFRLFVELLDEMARGHAVTIALVEAELTTQQAADLLNVSRPYLIRLIDSGQIPFRKVGNRRKVRMADLLTHKRRDDARRRATVDKLTAEAQRLQLGY